MRPSAATLEQTMVELTEELEAFRALRDTIGRGASTMSDIRAEQLQLDRRIDTRFSGVQEILERLVDRLDRDGGAEPSSALRTTPSSAPARAGMLDIPDRGAGDKRPAGAPGLDAAQIVAQGRAREGADGGNPKAAAINAHIAAARRAANAAAADGERREELEQARDAARSGGGFGRRAAVMFSRHRRPVLLGVAGLMTVLTGVAVVEMRGHAPTRKSELEIPATPLAQAEPPARETATDKTPTGAINAAPKVIATPLPPPKADAAGKPPAALIAALPAGLGGPLAAAGSNGDVGAEVEIAQRYLEGRGVPRDPKAAAGWMQAAADAGDAFAQYRLGALYEKGLGVDARPRARPRTLHEVGAGGQREGDAQSGRALCAGRRRRQARLRRRDRLVPQGCVLWRARQPVQPRRALRPRARRAAKSRAKAGCGSRSPRARATPTPPSKRDEVENRMDGRAMAEARKLLEGFKAKTPNPAVNDPPPVPAAAAGSAPDDGKAAKARG